MNKPVKVTVFPRLNADSCGTGCGISCSSCTGCDQSCGFKEQEQEQMDDLYFLLEEVGHDKCDNCQLEFIDTSDIDYSIERLNVVLVTSGEETVTHYTYGEYMTENSPIIAVNSKIITKGRIPSKLELAKVFEGFH
jgi:hypothetical protein